MKYVNHEMPTMNPNDPILPFELIWHEPRRPEQHQHFSTRAAADSRILEIRSEAREWVLLQDGEAVDWGYYER